MNAPTSHANFPKLPVNIPVVELDGNNQLKIPQRFYYDKNKDTLCRKREERFVGMKDVFSITRTFGFSALNYVREFGMSTTEFLTQN